MENVNQADTGKMVPHENRIEIASRRHCAHGGTGPPIVIKLTLFTRYKLRPKRKVERHGPSKYFTVAAPSSRNRESPHQDEYDLFGDSTARE
jgi:hypothetical protein